VLRQRVSAYSWNCRTQCHIVSLYWICTMASLDCSYYVSNYFRCLSHYPLPSYRPFHLILLLPFGPDGRNLVWFCTSDCRWLVSVLDFACRVGGGGCIYLISGFISMAPKIYFGLFNLWCGKVCVLAVLQPCMCCKCMYVFILYVSFIITCIYLDFLRIIMSRNCITCV